MSSSQREERSALQEITPAFTPAVAAEFIGMFLVTFLSAACAANAADNGLAAAALGTGFAFAMITYSTVHISGGHLNPAITAAYMAVGANGFTVREGISYMLAQFTGAITGAFLIKSILPIEALVHPFVTLGSLSDKHGEQVSRLRGFLLSLSVVWFQNGDGQMMEGVLDKTALTHVHKANRCFSALQQFFSSLRKRFPTGLRQLQCLCCTHTGVYSGVHIDVDFGACNIRYCCRPRTQHGRQRCPAGSRSCVHCGHVCRGAVHRGVYEPCSHAGARYCIWGLKPRMVGVDKCTQNMCVHSSCVLTCIYAQSKHICTKYSCYNNMYYAHVYVHINLSTQKSYLRTLNVCMCVRTINTYGFENLSVDIYLYIYVNIV